MRILLTILSFFVFSSLAVAVDSLSYSGRLVNANGSPVTGPVNLNFKLSYTDNPTVALCNKTINGVALSNGVFHIKLDFTVAECGGTLSLMQVLSATPLNESVAVQVTDLSHSKTYSYQAIHSVPTSLISTMAKTLDQLGAAPGEYLKWNGTKWIPAAAAGTGSGSVTQIDTGTGLSGGPITTTGTISIANGGVDTAQLATGAVTDAKVAVGAGIARSKLATGTPNYVLVNDASGVMSGVATLPLGQGGTGATTVPGVWTVLGLGTAAGKDVGNNIGNVMAADVVPSCLPFEKLQVSLAPYVWTCVTDANTDTTKLPLAGGTMEGDIDMDGNQILNLSAPIVGSDAANKTYVDAAVSGSAVWSVATGNTYRLTGNVGVGTSSPDRNIEVVNSDADEAMRITRAANASDEATIGFVPSGAASTTNQTWKMGLPINSNNFSLSAFDGSATTSVLLLSPVGMVIPRLTTTERDAVVTPSNGLQIYNTSTNELNYYNGSAWKALGVAGAGVTSLVAGTGLTGGTITSSGTIAVDVGTGPGKIVQLDGSSKLPAVDGSALTNLNPANLSAPVPITKGGTGLSAAGAGNTLVGMNNAGTAMEYKAISGTGVTITNGVGTMNFAVTGAPPTGAASGDLSGTYPSPTVVAIQGTPVSAGPASGNVLLYNGTSYAPTAISGDATLSSTGALTLGTVPVAKGGTGVTSFTAKGIVSVNAAGNGLVSTACGNQEVLSFNGSGDAVCSPISSLVATSFIQNGNSFAATAVLGTNDNNALAFETNNDTKMTILPSGNVGIGMTNPQAPLHINGPGSGAAALKITDANAGSSGTGIEIRSTTAVAQYIDFTPNSTSEANYGAADWGGRIIYNESPVTAGFKFKVNGAGSDAMVIASDGNVGIGVTAPVNNFQIGSMGSSGFGGNTFAAGNGTEVMAFHLNTTAATWYSNTNFSLMPSGGAGAVGNVGIGTLTPDSKLSLEIKQGNPNAISVYKNDVAAADGFFKVANATSAANVFIPIFSSKSNSTTASYASGFVSDTKTDNAGEGPVISFMARTSNGVVANRDLVDFSNFAMTGYGGTTAMRIKANGNVGIGTTAASEKLEVAGNIALSGKVRLQDTGTNYVEIKAPATVGTTYTLTLPDTAGTSGYALTTNGSGVLSWASVATTASAVGGDLSGTIANAQIVAGSVGTTELANSSVTYAKMSLADGDIPSAKINGLTAALAGKEPSITAGTATQYWRGDKTWQELITTNVPEGTNYYFTDARVSAALMSSYAVGTAIPLATTDTLNQALGKLEAQIVANNTANGDMWEKNSPHIYYNDGNVGIGTNAPAAKLEVVGTGNFVTGLGNLSFSPDYFGRAVIQSYQGPGVFRPLTVEGSDVNISTKGGPLTLSTETVNVGVDAGVTMGTYGTLLHFLGLTNNSDPFWMARYNVAGNVSELRMNIGDDPSAAQDSFVIGVTDSSWHPKMTVMSDGNVGIGTSTPAAKTHIYNEVDGIFNGLVIDNRKTYGVGTGNNEESRLVLSLTETTIPNPLDRVMGFMSAGTESETSSGNGYLAFGTRTGGGETEKVRITGAGNVGIGTTTPSAKLEVAGNIFVTNTAGGIFQSNVSNRDFDFYGDVPANRILTVHSGPNAASAYSNRIVQFFGHNGTTPINGFTLLRDGSAGIGTDAPSEKFEVAGNAKATAFLYSSDKRLKKNITPIKKPLEKVMALHGVEFVWKKTGEQETGLIAQEVEKVVPNLVETSAVDGMKSVKYGNIVALLIESTKEQQVQAQKAQREIASLKEENKKLKADIELIKRHLKIK